MTRFQASPVVRPARAPGLAALLVALVASIASAEPPGPAPPIVTSGDRPLRVLAGEASAIVLADVARTESFDEDRLRLYRVHVARVLRGRVDAPEPGIVDVRGTSTRAPLLADGERVVALVRPAPALSYLTKHLLGGGHFEVVGGRDGVVPVGSDAEVQVVERVLAESGADAETARRVAATELTSGNPRLAADALAELRRAEPLRPLSRADVEALGKALADRRIEPVTRAGLIELLGARRAAEAAPALATAEADTPAVLEALLTARADLGVASREQLAPQLGSQDPHVRGAAVRALARLDQPGVVAEVGRYATSDPDAGVRQAAIDALGATKRTEAVPILATTFDSSETRFQQHSAQAMLEIGGPTVDDALVGLALRGKTPQTRRYAALILLMQHGRDADVLRRIERSNPAPEVRELLEKGLQKPD